MVALYALIGCMEASNKYSCETNEIDQSSNVNTIMGALETQCISRRRRNADCDRTIYEKESHDSKSHCHFLKERVN